MRYAETMDRLRRPAPLRDLDMWDYMAVGFFAGAMLIAVFALTAWYFVRGV